MVISKSDDQPDDPAEPTNSTSGTMTKADAVRACLAETPDLSPADAVVRIKERYGLEIETTVFSSYRSQIRAKQEGRQSGQRGKTTATSTPMRELIAAVHVVKEVTDKHGIEAVRDVIDLAERYEAGMLADVVGLIDVLDGQRHGVVWRMDGGNGDVSNPMTRSA